MKQNWKFFLLGGLAGAVVMLAAILIYDWIDLQHPKLKQQVIEHLEAEGYEVDSVGGELYVFTVDGDRFIFDYFPKDQTYLRLICGYDIANYSMEEIMSACIHTMQTKKNCTIYPEQTEDGIGVRFCCESFLDDNEAIDPEIIDRSIRVMQQAVAAFYTELDKPHE